MRLKYELVTMETDGQTVAVPVGDNADEFRGLIRLNDTGADILDALKEDSTIDSIVNKLEEKYNAGHDELVACVNEFVERLDKEGMLIR